MAAATSFDFSIDRLPVGLQGCQLAVYPLKLQLGICTVSANCMPSFVLDQTFVISEPQFTLFGEVLADFCDSFDKLKSITSNNIQKLEINFQTQDCETRKIVQSVSKQGLSLILVQQNGSIPICIQEKSANGDLTSLIDAFIQLVLKAFCYTPLVTRAIKICSEHINLNDFKTLNEDKLFQIFKKLPTVSNIDQYNLCELILRHQDLLYQMQRLKLFRNKNVAATSPGSPGASTTATGTTPYS